MKGACGCPFCRWRLSHFCPRPSYLPPRLLGSRFKGCPFLRRTPSAFSLKNAAQSPETFPRLPDWHLFRRFHAGFPPADFLDGSMMPTHLEGVENPGRIFLMPSRGPEPMSSGLSRVAVAFLTTWLFFAAGDLRSSQQHAARAGRWNPGGFE